MKDLNYVIGRLHGLNELAKILKDLADKKNQQNSEIIAVMANHLADQLAAILLDIDKAEVEPQHRDALIEIKEKHAPAVQKMQEAAENEGEDEEEVPPKQAQQAQRDRIEHHEKTVDELLRDLENLKG